MRVNFSLLSNNKIKFFSSNISYIIKPLIQACCYRWYDSLPRNMSWCNMGAKWYLSRLPTWLRNMWYKWNSAFYLRKIPRFDKSHNGWRRLQMSGMCLFRWKVESFTWSWVSFCTNDNISRQMYSLGFKN